MLRGVVAVRREANGVAQLHGQVRGGDGAAQLHGLGRGGDGAAQLHGLGRGGDGAAQLHGHGRGGDGVMTTMHAWGGQADVGVASVRVVAETLRRAQ